MKNNTEHDPGLVTSPEINHYAERMSQPASSLLQNIVHYTENNVGGARMLSGPLVGGLLKILIKLSAAKVVLDVGTFTGYSALTLAESLGPEAKVYTCDRDVQMLKIAAHFFQESPDGQKIEVVLRDGLEFLTSTSEVFDLIFLDADKGRLLEYYEAALSKLKLGGLLVIDDVLWRGEVLTQETPKAQMLNQLNHHITNDPRVLNVLLPVRHGLQVILYTGV